MESQGATFALDPAMDFSAAFAPPPQHLFTKTVEDETSGFFGDEGIDTATLIDPTVFDTTQEQMFSPHLVSCIAVVPETLDYTSGSTSEWDTQRAPPLQNTMSTFPPTPIRSFGSMYQQGLSTSLGKRPLEIDQFDFPQAKRHESMSMGDFPLFPSMPTTASATTSNRGFDTHLAPPVGAIEFGLADDAADVCATWFHKFNVLPSDRHIESLSQLTGESADAIRSWFGRLLKQGMGSTQGDSAYKSQTSPTQHEPFWNGSYSTDTLQASPSQLFVQQADSSTTPEATCNHATTTVQPATILRGSKKRCTPTKDPRLLGRDPSKIYQCTRKCGKRYGRKCDWKRNEEEGYPSKSWVCSLCISVGAANVKPCFRKYHFVQHFRNIHPDVNADDHEETSIVSSETEFPRNCGFCRHRFVSRQDRIDHIADHFKAGKSMLDWREQDNDDTHDSDIDDDDDDDNGSSGDGFDGAPSLPPPSFDPRGDTGSKRYGGNRGSGAGAGGSGDLHNQGGFFQFQLSQLEESHDGAESPMIDPCTHTKGSAQAGREQLNAALEPGEDTALEPLHQDCSVHGKQSPISEDGEGALAGDVLSQSVINQQSLSANGLTDHFKYSGQVNEDLLITAGLGEHIETGHDGDSTSLTEATVLLPPTVSSRLRASGNGHCFLPHVLRSSSSSLSSSSALPHQIPQGVPPASQPFLSLRLLGAGGFSTVEEVVHRRTHLRLGRKTLKNRDESAIGELRKEISVLQKLRHPHVIRFLDAYSSGDKMSILLSPVAETTLALWLERTLLRKPANMTDTIVSMFGCLASSVRYLHEQRPVVKHMDIKPQNILIVDSDSALPQVVLCDFGISSSEDLSDEHAMPITRQYTAPEVFEGSTRKQAADIWSLGCVFAEMASVSFSQGNVGWLDFRKAFSGRTGKYYWQDVLDVQARLSTFVEGATSATEQTVARTLKTMLSPEPMERPDAASLIMIFTPAPCCLNWPNDKAVFPGPREELDWVKDLDCEDGVDCHAKHHSHSVIPEASSNKMFAAEDWLKDCSDSHSACKQVISSDATLLPKRLVDLLPNGQNESYIRVVNSIDIEQTADRVEYMALSHIWNHSQPLLLSSTMTDLRNGLPLDRLPEALNMAIATTQRLGYRYIWTDALCVVQDSMTDKEQECKAMASVFRNAALTVVLDQLVSTSLENQTLVQDTPDDPKCSSATNAGAAAPRASLPAIDFTTPGFAWDTRAWVLQERLLSHRFLHVGKQLYWECNTLKASETFPRGLSRLVWEKVHSRRSGSRSLPRIEHRRASESSLVRDTCTLETRVRQLSAGRLRDSQLTRKEGDGVGDSMEAAQSMLQLGGGFEDAYSPLPDYEATASEARARVRVRVRVRARARAPHCGGISSTTDASAVHRMTHLPRPATNASSVSKHGSTHPPTQHQHQHRHREHDNSDNSPTTPSSSPPAKPGRQEIATGGQLDQHGTPWFQGPLT